MKISDLAGRRVAILGAGLEGRAALAAIGQRVGWAGLTLLDEKPIEPHPMAATCWGPLAELQLNRFEAVVRSPGFSIYRPELRAALQSGVQITSGSSLWLAENPAAPVLAVTGTKGKSTTSSLLAHLLNRAGLTVALGGNIGQPVITFLDRSTPDWYVVELSSYQIADLSGQVEVAVLTNLLSDHLDWHGSQAQYHQDKQRLLTMARRGTVVHSSARRVVTDQPVTAWAGSSAGWRVEGGNVLAGDRRVAGIEGWQLPGRHNLNNLEVALAAVDLCGADVEAALTGISDFEPLPHRLQPVAGVAAPACINDSIATTPDATVAAINCFPRASQVLIVGGYERQQDWRELARSLAETPLAEVIVQGACGDRLAQALAAGSPGQPVRRCANLSEAVETAFARCDPDGVLVFSPGAPSFDQFDNFVQRGEAFIDLCRQQVSPAG